MNRQEILKVKISLLIVKHKMTFINTIDQFINKLKLEFNEDYDYFEVGNALGELETSTIEFNQDIVVPENFKV